MVPQLVIHEYWRDTRTDHVWAVEIEDGKLVACFGPLSLGEAQLDGELLDGLGYSTRRVSWLDTHRDRFRPWEPHREIIWPT